MKEDNKEEKSYFETENSKKMTHLFWKYQDIRVHITEMGFFR